MGWQRTRAAYATSLLSIVATAAQLLVGPFLGVLETLPRKLVFLFCLSLLGVATFTPLMAVAWVEVGDGLVWTAIVAMGVTVG